MSASDILLSPDSLENARQLLADSALDERLKMTYEERIEAHENARQLLIDLKNAGESIHAKPEISS